MLGHLGCCLYSHGHSVLHHPVLGVLLIRPQVDKQLQRRVQDFFAPAVLLQQASAACTTSTGTHLSSLIYKVWVPAKLLPQLHILMRNLRQGEEVAGLEAAEMEESC